MFTVYLGKSSFYEHVTDCSQLRQATLQAEDEIENDSPFELSDSELCSPEPSVDTSENEDPGGGKY